MILFIVKFDIPTSTIGSALLCYVDNANQAKIANESKPV